MLQIPNINDLFELGRFVKQHSLQNMLVLEIDADNPKHYSNLQSVYLLIKGRPIPFSIQKQKWIGANSKLIQLEDVLNEDLPIYVNQIVYLPIDQLPKLKKGQYYFHDLPGLKVIDANYGEIGVVVAHITGKNPILTVDHNGIEVLIPFQDAFIKAVDIVNQTVTTEIPEGLLEIYLNDKD